MKTTKINETKKNAVNEIRTLFENAKDVLFTDFRGLSVSEISQLRNTLREAETDYKVVKNNYTKIAMEELGLPDVSDILFGPTALALTKSDIGPVAKAILDFGKDTSLAIKGGVVGGKVFSLDEIKALSALPGREHLLAMLMGTMNAPLQNLTNCLNGVMQNLVRTLQAIAEKKGSEGA
jgi:large subunit ribosomal protein L10